MEETEPVLLKERRGNIALVTLNRPAKRNALNDALWQSLKQTFETMEPDVRAIVLAGKGDHFCAGLDLSEHLGREPFESIATSRFGHATLDAIGLGQRPVIAAMHGAVIGGGLELAVSAHIRVADDTAFYQMPEGRRGIFIGGGGSVHIARIIGAGRMVEMMLTGRIFNADTGDRLGLSHYVVGKGKALDKAIELAELVAGNAKIPNWLIIQGLPRIADMASADGLWTESVAQALSLTSDDAREGMKAFLERRKIDFGK